MPNAWQDYAALIFAFYNRSGIAFGITIQFVCNILYSWFLTYLKSL